MDTVFDLWIEMGVLRVFTDSPSPLPECRLPLTRARDTEEAVSLAFGWVKGTQRIAGVFLIADFQCNDLPSNIFFYSSGWQPPRRIPQDTDLVSQFSTAATRPSFVLGQFQDSSVYPLLCKTIVPLLASPESLDLFPDVPDNFYGRVGPYGDLTGNMILQNSDMVFLIGKVSIKTNPESFVRQGFVIHVGEISPSLPFHGFVSLDSLRNILANATKNLWPQWIPFCREWRSRWLHAFPPENIIQSPDGVDPYIFHTLLHQLWDQKHLIVQKDEKWFPPAFQHGILATGNKFIAVPKRLDTFHATRGFCQTHPDYPVFVIADQSAFSSYHIQLLEENPLPVVLFFFKCISKPSILSSITTFLEKRFYHDLSDKSFDFPDLPLLIEINVYEEFQPYPKQGVLALEQMSGYDENDMLVPPYP